VVIVETTEQFENFIEQYRNSDCILMPILSDVNKHPLQNRLSLLYVKLLEGDEYILPFNHSEAINLPQGNIFELNFGNKKYTFSKKELNHVISFKNVVDINFQYYMKYNLPLEVESFTTNSHQYFYNTFYHKENINDIIPILKHLELCRKLCDEYKKYIDLPVHETYNVNIINNLTYLESSGLRYNNEMVYSEYYPYTSTGRPSNRFGGINFAALNKTDGSRKPFYSRFENGMLVEFDYDAYHLRLIGEVVNYKFPEGSVHEHMGEFYGCDYQESKNRSFQYLYGHIPIDVVQINPFFSKVDDYINKIWGEYKRKDFITSNIYNKKIFRKNLSNMNRNKLFNYMIQLMETENNMKMLNKLIPIFDNYYSKLILYSYDSFLIDYDMNDGKKFLNEIKNIIEFDGKFPIKMSRGINYHEMEKIN
jgi:hypothetical protein